MTTKDIPFIFGQDNVLPPLTSGSEFFALRAVNFIPEFNHFRPLNDRKQTLESTGAVLDLEYIFSANNDSVFIYAFGKNEIRRVLTPTSSAVVETFSNKSGDKWGLVRWKETLYATKLDVPLRRVSGLTSTELPIVSNTYAEKISARYAISAHDKLWLGNFYQTSTLHSNRVRWSDTYNPENFEISETTESDYFDLSVNDVEITGLLPHRNQVVIFSANSIWTARYVGLPTVYQFEPAYSTVGCTHHYSAVEVYDRIYFIGIDDVYVMDSFQIKGIKCAVWPEFSLELKKVSSAPATYDKERGIIYWNTGEKTFVYSVEENRWTTMDRPYVNDVLSIPRGIAARPIDGYPLPPVIDDYPQTIESSIDGVSISTYSFHAAGSFVYEASDGAGATVYDSILVLPPCFFGDQWSEKDLTEVLLNWKKVGDPEVFLSVNGSEEISPGRLSPEREADHEFFPETIFKVRNTNYGKFLQFTLRIRNNEQNYFTNLIGLSVRYNDAKAKR